MTTASDIAHFPDLKGRSVFITGGGSGIGAALTEGFLRQGASVAFCQRSDASGFVAEMAEATGQAPLFLPCDVTDTDALRATLAQAAEAHGPITVLVNNAAFDDRHSTGEVTEAYWQKMIDVNLKHYFFASQAVIPGMKAAGGGAIVNFSSISYMMGLGDYPIYTSANGAITAMTRGMAREFGPDRIRVNAIAPGWVLTDRQMDKWASPEKLDAHLARACLKNHLVAADMAGPVMFLASDAARMMTGQCIAVDGGVVTVSA